MRSKICGTPTVWTAGAICCVVMVALLGNVQPVAAQGQGDTGYVVPTWKPVCRTPGFWGARGGNEKGGWNYTQSAIDAVGCLNVCGVDICGTDQPDLFGTLGSALEALCVRNNDPTQLNQTFRQAVATALNCSLSGRKTPELCAALVNRALVGITWEQCNANCALGGGADEDLLNICYSQLDCLNNGWKWFDMPDGFIGCAAGSCSIDGDPCGSEAGGCAPATACDAGYCIYDDFKSHISCVEVEECPAQECVMFSGCHDRGLCESDLRNHFGPPFRCDPEEKLGPAGSSGLCRDSRRNTCTISNSSSPMSCGDNPCTGFCP